MAIHNWFDETKGHMPDFRHRALRHHAEGIQLCVKIFGDYVWLYGDDGDPITYVESSSGEVKHKFVPTLWVAEQHVREDHGRIPTAADWLRNLRAEPWMSQEAKRSPELMGEYVNAGSRQGTQDVGDRSSQG
jgi:riboflavin synthase